MEDYIPSSSSFNTGLGHIMPHRRTRKKKKKKRRKNQIHDHQSLPTRNVLLPFNTLLNPQSRKPRNQILKNITPKIIIHQTIPPQFKIHQFRLLLVPFRPINQLSSTSSTTSSTSTSSCTIRIQIMNKSNIITLQGPRRKRYPRIPKGSEKYITGVKCAQNGCSVEICGEITPSGNNGGCRRRRCDDV